MEAGSCSAHLRRERRPTNQVGHMRMASFGFGAWTSIPPSPSPSTKTERTVSLKFYTQAFYSFCSYNSINLHRLISCCSHIYHRNLMLPDVQAMNDLLTFLAVSFVPLVFYAQTCG